MTPTRFERVTGISITAEMSKMYADKINITNKFDTDNRQNKHHVNCLNCVYSMFNFTRTKLLIRVILQLLEYHSLDLAIKI